MSEAAAVATKKRGDKDEGVAMERERTLLVFDLVGEY